MHFSMPELIAWLQRIHAAASSGHVPTTFARTFFSKASSVVCVGRMRSFFDWFSAVRNTARSSRLMARVTRLSLTFSISSSIASGAVKTSMVRLSLSLAPSGSVTVSTTVCTPTSRQFVATAPAANGTGLGSMNHRWLSASWSGSLESEPSRMRQAFHQLQLMSTGCSKSGEKSTSASVVDLRRRRMVHRTDFDGDRRFD